MPTRVRSQHLVLTAALLVLLSQRLDVRGDGLSRGHNAKNATMQSRTKSGSVVSRTDLRIVFWYERARPLDTFHYQVYDMRKGEYTAAVDRWLSSVARDYPGFAAYVREVSLARELGANDRLRTGSAILREFLALQAELGGDIGPSAGGLTQPAPPGMRPASRPSQGLTSRPPAGLDLSPAVNMSPFPFPYPRPHP